MHNKALDVHEKFKLVEKELKVLTKDIQALNKEKEVIEKKRTEALKTHAQVELDVKDLELRISADARTEVCIVPNLYLLMSLVLLCFYFLNKSTFLLM